MSEEPKKTTLTCQEGTCNKFYTIWIEPKDGGYVVLAQGGGLGGGHVQSWTKTPKSVSFEEATKLMNRVIKEKLTKSPPYKYSGEPSPAFTHIEVAKDTGMRPMLLTEGTEEDLEWLIKSPEWAVQEKKNGKHIEIRAEAEVITGANKSGLECAIPEEVVKSLRGSIDFSEIDGEMIKNTYHTYDIMRGTKKEDYTKLAMTERHGILTAFVAVLKLGKQLAIKIVPYITGEKEKRTFVEQMRKEGREGVVFKKLTGQYIPGKILNIKNAVVIKVKFYKEGSFIVNAWNERNSISLLAIDGKKRVHVGNVTVHEKYKPQIVVGGVIRIKYLYATDAGILYQPNLDPDDNGNVMRDDQSPGDCVKAQLKYEGKD